MNARSYKFSCMCRLSLSVHYLQSVLLFDLLRSHRCLPLNLMMVVLFMWVHNGSVCLFAMNLCWMRFIRYWYTLFVGFSCQVYSSTSRDSLLAAVRDLLQSEVGRCVLSWLPTTAYTAVLNINYIRLMLLTELLSMF